jgi:hypothetical protein
MVNTFSDWLCNLMLWAAVITLFALLYDTFAAPGSLASGFFALAGLGLAVVLALLWPKY